MEINPTCNLRVMWKIHAGITGAAPTNRCVKLSSSITDFTSEVSRSAPFPTSSAHFQEYLNNRSIDRCIDNRRNCRFSYLFLELLSLLMFSILWFEYWDTPIKIQAISITCIGWWWMFLTNSYHSTHYRSHLGISFPFFFVSLHRHHSLSATI